MKFRVTRTPWQIALITAASLGALSASPALATPLAQTQQELPRELGKPEDEDISVRITRFQVDGLPTASRADIDRITAPYIGENKGYEDLMNAAAAVTHYMQTELGYYVGFAYVPTQNAANGTVKLQALEGRLDTVDVVVPEGAQSEQHRQLINRQMAHLQSGDVLYTAEVERTVLLLNDIPGLEARVEIEEGSQPGTAKLKVTGSPLDRHSVRLNVDSQGTRLSGLYRASVALTSTGVLAAGDAVNAELLSSHTGEFKQATVGYVVPVGSQGWKVGGVASHVEYEAEAEAWGMPMSFKGVVNVAGAYALYPVVRSRDFNAFGLVSYEHKRITDKSNSYFQPKKFSNDWILGVVGDARDATLGGGITTYDAQLVWGKLDYGQMWADTDVSFHKATWNIGRLQNLVPNRFQAYAKFQGQLSNSDLDVSEHYVAGGPSAVRAFEPGAVSGDQGYLMSAELRWLPSTETFGETARELMFSVFYDWAKVKIGPDAPWVYNENTFDFELRENVIISGYGVGVTWESSKDFSLHMNLAWRKHQNIVDYPRSSKPRFNFTLSKRF